MQLGSNNKNSHIIRPSYELIDPDKQRNIHPKLFKLLSIFTGIFIVSYSLYAGHSFYSILSQATGISLVLNLVVYIVEILIGYYAILLFYHFAKGFAPITHPLDPKLIFEKNGEFTTFPTVTIMLPMYKEPFSIIKQTLMAAMDIDYPKSSYKIMVVDDSDENIELVNYCEESNIEYVTRNDRKGFKAGGINNALKFVASDYILFMDADHILERNIIKNCLLSWREDTIAVQTRIDFVNMRTFLTTISAFLQLQFFSLFQRARRASGSAIFAGGAALFDANLLKSLGGFDPLTIADDTDNSFIFRSKGHRIEYIDVVGAFALVPWDPLHLIRQIWRWLTGITRSFRARWQDILRGKSSIYIKLDHFSTGFFPTLSIFGWGVAFIFIILVINDYPVVRSSFITTYPSLAIIPALIPSLPIIVGTIAVFIDDKRILFHQKNILYKIAVTLSFYLLILAAQPLLIGAIFKGLTGKKVSFNRTPKEKNSTDDLTSIKKQYLLQAVTIFIIGLIFLYFALSIPLNDARAITLLISSYAAIIPLIISILWYWKLEGYLDEVADITALEVLRDIKY